MSLEELFGNSVLVKAIDFFLENRFWDYTKSDVANHIGNSRQQVYKIWPKLKIYGIVIPSRKIGRTILYKTNLDSKLVKSFSKLSLSISDVEV